MKKTSHSIFYTETFFEGVHVYIEIDKHSIVMLTAY